MQRFYIKSFKKEESFILEDKEISHQLKKVLRIKEGEKVIFFDGLENIDFVYEIVQINNKNIILKLDSKIQKDSELNFELNLFQAMPNKLDKIEYILQKGVEIGYKKFVFYRSERSQKLVISEKKEERLKKIIVEAVEQSGRNFVPEFDLTPSPSPLEERGKNVNIFLHTKNNNSQNLSEFIKNKNSLSTEGFSPLKEVRQDLNIFIGPEGGFSDNEVNNCEKNNFSRIHLGNRILRTETAGIVVGFTLGQII
ncbi:MAG: RsmE family RNA methyltransferase [Candidatus Gracilibacteria bacterium]|nr:RsmE family RNA methyltransferase [Candidatus Gracilibacteria bacterium]MDQ7023051.1 RsmE family RNA methyltransferase [Candidatus Gracilibacteria bacterium]